MPYLLLLIVLLSVGARAQAPASTNYDESKVGAYTLPDPLGLQ